MKIKLEIVHYMPKTLSFGVLYVSEEFQTCAHLCPCGCGSKITTPLGPTEWSFSSVSKKRRATLSPSIGNWQIPCRSHYWITNGEVLWAEKWSEKQIKEGRTKEQKNRRKYYDSMETKKKTIFHKIWLWVKKIIKF